MMTEEQKYLFDLQGYLIVPDILTSEQVGLYNKELDRLLAMSADQFPGNSIKRDKSEAVSAKGSDVLIENIAECGEAFEKLIDHPASLGYLREMIGHSKIRLSASSSIIRAQGDLTPLHRGRTPILGQFQYRFENGKFYCNLIVMMYCLTDLEQGSGGLSVIPGSHKSNFPNAYSIKGHPEKSPCPDDVPALIELQAKAGDAILFTEDLTHGSKTNLSNKQRRNLYYRYQPSFCSPNITATKPVSQELMDRLTPERKELLDRIYGFG